jgi:hypothetical protein
MANWVSERIETRETGSCMRHEKLGKSENADEEQEKARMPCLISNEKCGMV